MELIYQYIVIISHSLRSKANLIKEKYLTLIHPSKHKTFV